VNTKPKGCLKEFAMKTMTATVLMLSMTLGTAAHADGHDRHYEHDRGEHHERSHEPAHAPGHWNREPQRDWQRHDYTAHNWNDNSHHDWHAPSRSADHWNRGSDHWGHDYHAYAVHPEHRYYGDHYYRPYGYAPRVWRHGDYLPRAYCAPRYFVDYRPYRLSPPPYGYGWVRVDHDIFLTAIATGLVVSAVYDVF
jgi:Ni/Co efflux regulator RcnB